MKGKLVIFIQQEWSQNTEIPIKEKILSKKRSYKRKAAVNFHIFA